MLELLHLPCLAVVIVAASVGCIVGVRRLTYWTRLDRYFIGEVGVTLAWVLPEYLIAVNAVNAPGALPYHSGDPFVSVGAIMGSAAANMLVIGVLDALRPGRSGSEPTGRVLGSAATVLLVTCLAVVGLGVTRGQGMTVGRLIAGCVVSGVLFACARLVNRSIEKAKPIEPDPMFHQGRGTLIGSLAVSAVSIVILAYATLPFVELVIPWFRSGDDLPHAARALLDGGMTIALGLFLAVPDLIVAARDPSEGDTPRLLNSAAALIAFTVFCGLSPDSLHDAFASSLFASFILTVFVVALTLILLLAIPSRLSARSRGLIVLGVASAGFVFSLVSTGH